MKVWAWGANGNGQLGLGFHSEQESTPTEVSLNGAECIQEGCEVNPIDICGSASHLLILANVVPTKKESKFHHNSSPVFIKISDNFQLVRFPQVEKLCAGFDTHFFLFPKGEMKSFGDNCYSQLGRKIKKEEEGGKNTYTNVWGGLDEDDFSNVELPLFDNVAAGLRHSAGISGSSELYVWGDNSKYQLGIYEVTPEGREEYPRRVDIPTKVEFPGVFHYNIFRKVVCGKDFTIAVHHSEGLFGCGQNKYGVLLHAPQDIKEFKQFTPIFEKLADKEIWDIKCGWNHVLVLLADGRVISWGRNDFGQLGRRSVNPNFDVEPGYVIFPEKIVSIKCGSEHSLALTISGALYSWGWNEHDNCGVKVSDQSPPEAQLLFHCEDTNSSTSEPKKDCIEYPTLVTFPGNLPISVIGCGAGSSYAISE